MVFEFAKYVEPVWYYNISPKGDVPYWLDFNKVSDEHKRLVSWCHDYSTPQAQLADAALQLFKAGCIEHDPAMALPQQGKVVAVADNYLYVRRYFSKHWLHYILMLRVLSFKNPIKEIRGYLKALKAQPFVLPSYAKPYGDYADFKSPLVEKQPLVSVIIPTLNRYTYLNDLLNDLEKQDYPNFEVIVCDQSDPIDRTFYEGRKLNIRLIEQREKALWLARNNSIEAAKGDIVALSDDDMRMPADWLTQHLKCLDYFDLDISAGLFYNKEMPINIEKLRFRWASQFSTSNVLLYKRVFKQVGLFDRQFEKQRMGDGEFGMRCYMNGMKSVWNHMAAGFDVKAAEGGLREMGSWDSIRPTKLFAPRPVPSVLYYIRRYYGLNYARYYILKNFPKMLIPYKYRNSRTMLPIGLLGGLLFLPVVITQIVISWRRSSKMLKNGPRIEPFK